MRHSSKQRRDAGKNTSRRQKTSKKTSSCPEICSGVAALGTRDSFPFEEQAFLKLAAKALGADGVDRAGNYRLATPRFGLKLGKGESQGEWALVEGLV